VASAIESISLTENTSYETEEEDDIIPLNKHGEATTSSKDQQLGVPVESSTSNGVRSARGRA
jgi:hypothetical protein